MMKIFKKITFYDYRNLDQEYAKAHKIKGYILFRHNNKWLLWLNKTDNINFSGLIVVPETLYLYNVYIPHNLIDAIKKML